MGDLNSSMFLSFEFFLFCMLCVWCFASKRNLCEFWSSIHKLKHIYVLGTNLNHVGCEKLFGIWLHVKKNSTDVIFSANRRQRRSAATERRSARGHWSSGPRTSAAALGMGAAALDFAVQKYFFKNFLRHPNGF